MAAAQNTTTFFLELSFLASRDNSLPVLDYLSLLSSKAALFWTAYSRLSGPNQVFCFELIEKSQKDRKFDNEVENALIMSLTVNLLKSMWFPDQR